MTKETADAFLLDRETLPPHAGDGKDYTLYLMGRLSDDWPDVRASR